MAKLRVGIIGASGAVAAVHFQALSASSDKNVI